MHFFFLNILTLVLLIGSGVSSAIGQNSIHNTKLALRIVNRNAEVLDNISQLLVVFNETPGSDIAVLVALEKKNQHWQPEMPVMLAGIGRKGFAVPDAKREGDQKSPTGLFRLDKLFCYDSDVHTQMPFIHSTADDKWIDDPDSEDYNCYVRGTTNAKSWENLLLKTNDYRYCMVIEYNMNPVVKGKGSAIFLHLGEHETINSSAGCVVVTQKDMENLLSWMKPELKPAILMGNSKVLISGLKNKN